MLAIYQDSAEGWQLGFQESASGIMEGIVDLHHDIFFFIILIVIAVILILFDLTSNFLMDKHIMVWSARIVGCVTLLKNYELPSRVQHNTNLEIIWTLFPCIILFLIAIPSFSLLYVVEDFNIIDSTIKIIGNQWFWTYELPISTKYLTLVSEKTFDSVMLQETDLKTCGLRLLEVDNRLCLPIEKQLRLFITSTDVLHSWAVPSLGVKIDACPGRLNQISLWINRVGVYYGQCSEICGINHSFMPIVVNAVEDIAFLKWLQIIEFYKK